MSIIIFGKLCNTLQFFKDIIQEVNIDKLNHNAKILRVYFFIQKYPIQPKNTKPSSVRVVNKKQKIAKKKKVKYNIITSTSNII